MKTLTDEQRVTIVLYRMENARKTLEEVPVHRENGFYNTAINRMYYACYYAANALLVAHGIEAKSHDGVRQQLGKQFVLTGLLSSDLGKFYSRLFAKRTTADYEDFINHTAETVDEMFPEAQLFICTLGNLVDAWLISKER